MKTATGKSLMISSCPYLIYALAPKLACLLCRRSFGARMYIFALDSLLGFGNCVVGARENLPRE